MTKKPELTPQQRANQRQNEKRKNQPKYLLLMTDEENDILEARAKKYGSKKAAIMAGLDQA